MEEQSFMDHFFVEIGTHFSERSRGKWVISFLFSQKLRGMFYVSRRKNLCFPHAKRTFPPWKTYVFLKGNVECDGRFQ